MELLSQDEIEKLLAAIDAGDTSPLSIENFEEFLTKRKFEPENVYGFQKSVTVCRFFESKDNEKTLADIEQKNREQGMGNISIPNTSIKLVNYSLCPVCKTVFSFKDLMDYYRNPKPDPAFRSRGIQLRDDTRVCCSECGDYFLPALVIVDGTPRNEVQFLCRMQTVDEIERYFLGIERKVLSKNKKNIFRGNGFITIRNDVELKQLEPKPTLISNLLQYTPANLLPNLIDGSNVEKGDILFGKWNPIAF